MKETQSLGEKAARVRYRSNRKQRQRSGRRSLRIFGVVMYGCDGRVEPYLRCAAEDEAVDAPAEELPFG